MDSVGSHFSGNIEIQPEHYSVKKNKLHIGDKACVVRQNGKVIEDVRTLKAIADTFNKTLEGTPTIKKNEVWKVNPESVQVFDRTEEGTLKSAPKREIAFIDESAHQLYKQFFETTTKVRSVANAALQSTQTKEHTHTSTYKTLNSTPNSRYSPKLLAKRLILNYGNPEKIITAIEGLRTNDIRFNGKNDFFSVDKADLKVILDALKNASVKETKDKINPKKLQSAVATDLVGLVKRKPVTADAINETGPSMCQTSGHVNEKGEFTKDGKTVSSLLQKTDATVCEIANHAVITLGDSHNSNDEVVLSRSARTDTADKIDKKSLADIQARLDSTSKNGLVKVNNSDGSYHYEYQRVDISLMDANVLKSIATTLRSGIRNFKSIMKGEKTSPVENERRFLRNKKRGIKEIWNKKESKVDPASNRRYIERTCSETVNGVKQEVKVREYEPLVSNFVFSGQAKKPDNVKSARLGNIEPAVALLRTMVENTQDLQKYKDTFDLSPTKRNKRLVELIEIDLKSEVLPENTKSALRAVLITLTGLDENKKNYDTKEGSGQQFLAFALLSEVANAAKSIECKSGNDRSLTAVALLCSAKEWQRNHEGNLYDPTQETDHSSFSTFKNSFNKYVTAFGPQNLLAARGVGENDKADLKTGKSPVFMRYAEDHVEEIKKTFNILGLKEEK